jgi:hypothetical protein
MLHVDMAMRANPRTTARSLGERAFLLAILLPALLLGPALGGRAIWLHSHGQGVEHLHLLPASASADRVETLDVWHELEHEDADHSHPDDHGPAPHGLVLQVPILHFVSSSPAGAESLPASFFLAIQPFCGRHGDALRGVHRAEPRRSGWPPDRGARSGVAAVLRSSHAILI